MKESTVTKIVREIKSLFIIILIALSLRATVIEAYIVPTGSMENTIMTGDFLIGNKFVYGMRTPDWIGIPYTEIGVYVPWTRFPEFRQPRRGDVVIFKYPRDDFQKYVKRCIAEPGQTIEVREKSVWIDGEEFELPQNGKFVDRNVLSPDFRQPGIFMRGESNRDNLGPITMPKGGDIINIDEETNWDYLLPIMIMDGHEVTVEGEGLDRRYRFTMRDPNDVARRYMSGLGSKIFSMFSRKPYGSRKVERLYGRYYSNVNQNGEFLNVWNFHFTNEASKYLTIDGRPLSELGSYTVKQNYYWMMGDNRDDSADSRYWGFVPHDLILGEALFVYMSWDFKGGGPRFSRVGTIIR